MKIKFLALLLFIICSIHLHAQTMVVELDYTMGNGRYSALCVFNGREGKCHVVNSMGHCWYDTHYTDYGSHQTISIINPSWAGWFPAIVYITEYGNYIEAQGIRYQVAINLVPSQYWQDALSRYGFPAMGSELTDVSASYYDDIDYEDEDDSESSSDSSDTLIVVCVIIGVVVLFFVLKKK